MGARPTGASDPGHAGCAAPAQAPAWETPRLVALGAAGVSACHLSFLSANRCSFEAQAWGPVTPGLCAHTLSTNGV